MGIRVFYLTLFICVLNTNLSYSHLPERSSLFTDSSSVNINQDSTQRNPDTSKIFSNKPNSDKNNIDTTQRFYKFLAEHPGIIHSKIKVQPDSRDHIFHRYVEDYFTSNSHIYLHDKMDYGQYNEIWIGGLGSNYQLLWLDDILLNDPITMKARYQLLSTESFSSLLLAQGYEALAIGLYPLSLQSTTERLVAAKGYTRITYFQFVESNLKTDVTFSLNLSERLNFYTNYVRESTDGRYTNINGFGTDRFSSAYEANKFNIQFRYQLGLKTYITLSDYLFLLQQKPYGGVNYSGSLSLDLDPLDPLSAIVQNQFTERYTLDHTIKTEFESRLGFLPDSTNHFKLWLAYSSFKQDYEKSEETVLDSTLFKDQESSSRITLGMSEHLDFEYWRLNIRGLLLHDKISSQNTLTNQDRITILPKSTRIWLNAYNEINLKNLIFGQTLKSYGSIALSQNVISGTNGQDHNSSSLGIGVGGQVNFHPWGSESQSYIESFFNASRSSRLPSFKEVFASNLDIEGKQNWVSEDITQLSIGTGLNLGEETFVKFSYLQNRVESPLVVIQSIASDSTIHSQYRNLSSSKLNYSAIGIDAQLKLWKLTSNLGLTAILEYNLLDNPDQDYKEGIIDNPSYFSEASTNQIFYLPKYQLRFGIFFTDTFFQNALRLKTGFSGFIMSPVSAGLQNSERQQVLFFNLLDQDGSLRDNNLQFGTQGVTAQIDFRLWADIGSAVVSVSFENLLDETYFQTPYFYSNSRALRLGFTWLILD